MAPLVLSLAQSESKARFFERLGLDQTDRTHKRVYALMKVRPSILLCAKYAAIDLTIPISWKPRVLEKGCWRVRTVVLHRSTKLHGNERSCACTTRPPSRPKRYIASGTTQRIGLNLIIGSSDGCCGSEYARR